MACLAIESLSLAAANKSTPPQTVEHETARQAGMVAIPTGSYHPFFKRADDAQELPVDAFRLDAAPVTKFQYLEFVRSHATWRKSRIKGLLAERNYLADWVDDLDPGADLQGPVTFVSWFAARAYCGERGRLPSVAEWERVAGATPDSTPLLHDANPAKPFQFAMGKLAADVGTIPLQFGGVWEWTEDFNSTPSMSTKENARSDSSLFCGDGYRSNNAADYAAFLRYSLRSSLRANYALKNLGFRCAH